MIKLELRNLAYNLSGMFENYETSGNNSRCIAQ